MGQAAGAKEGGIVEQIMTELNISCAADKIPESIEINVSSFEIGDILHVGEIVLPEGVSVLDDPERTAISVVLPAKPAETTEAVGEETVATAETTAE